MSEASSPRPGVAADDDERRRRKFKRIVLAVAAVILLVEGYVAVFRRENDFVFHRNLGTAFLSGDPYSNQGDWYPLPRVMFNALLAALPMRVARGVSFALALGALYWIIRRWHDLGDLRQPLDKKQRFAAATLACFVILPYLLRDLDECGLQMFLLFFLTAAGRALSRGKSVRAGFWLATAAVYKATPVLCLPFLLWKRRWTAAAAMVAWIGVWAVAPAAFLGWNKTVESHARFLARNQIVAAHRTAYPELPDFEPPKPQNQSLFAAAARYVETYPPGHPLVLDHRWFRQFGSLDSETAYRVVRGVVLIFGLALAWRFRRSWKDGTGSADLPLEWAVVSMLCALAAPLCWKQHLIVSLPAVLLVARAATAGGPGRRYRLIALGVISAAIILARHSIAGRETSILLMSYKVDTMAMLGVLALLFSTPAAASGNVEVLEAESSAPRLAA